MQSEEVEAGTHAGPPSQSGSEFCFIHDPGSSEARRAAQRGAAKHARAPSPRCRSAKSTSVIPRKFSP